MPNINDMLVKIKTNAIPVHSTKKDLTNRQILSFINHLQKDCGLERGENGGWNDALQSKLYTWFLKCKKGRSQHQLAIEDAPKPNADVNEPDTPKPDVSTDDAPDSSSESSKSDSSSSSSSSSSKGKVDTSRASSSKGKVDTSRASSSKGKVDASRWDSDWHDVWAMVSSLAESAGASAKRQRIVKQLFRTVEQSKKAWDDAE